MHLRVHLGGCGGALLAYLDRQPWWETRGQRQGEIKGCSLVPSPRQIQHAGASSHILLSRAGGREGGGQGWQ